MSGAQHIETQQSEPQLAEPSSRQEAGSHPNPSAPGARMRKTLLFVSMIVGVVGAVTALSRLDPPPHLPRDSVHLFRFDTHGRLMGIGAEAPGAPALVEHAELRLDLKAIETRINGVCAQCHGQPGEDLSAHACAQGAGPCIPNAHPPKNTCIKCHRHAKEAP